MTEDLSHMQLKDKVAIVTGAASGINRAIAVRFAESGAAGVIATSIWPKPT